MTLLAIVLVLVAIAVVGDRVAAQLATRELRARLVSEVHNHGVSFETMDVGIGGFPFLSQVAKGHYDSITIDMTQIGLTARDGRTATLPTLHAVATGVDADTADVVRGDAKVVADRVDGTALVSFDTLETAVDYADYHLSDVRFAESNGALKATGTATVAGAQVPLTAVGDISVVNGQLQVKLRDATAVGIAVPQVAKDFLASLAVKTLAARLPALPFGLRLDQVSVSPKGLAVSAKGVQVPLAT